MEPIDAFVLGVVQGVAEWLPVSSSGHLVLLRQFLGMKPGVSFDVFLHLSALFVILFFFRKDFSGIIKGISSRGRKSYEWKLVLYIAAATLVTGLLGIFVRPYMDSLASIKVIPFTFLFTSVLLFASGIKGRKQQAITLKTALFIGLLQGLALFPGVSRSGATISAAKISGAGNEEAFRFSFLLAVPAIAGAILFEIKNWRIIPLPLLMAGFFTSFIFGMASLWFLKKALIKGRFYLFGFYTLLLSLLLFIF